MSASEKSREDIKRLRHDLSQARINAQAASAISSDARSMSLLGSLFASASLLVGLGDKSFVPVAMYLGAFTLVLAAARAGYTARPTYFYFPGARPSDFAEDIDKSRDYSIVLDELSKYYEKHIELNEKTNKRNARVLLEAIYLAIAGTIIAIAPQFFSFILTD